MIDPASVTEEELVVAIEELRKPVKLPQYVREVAYGFLDVFSQMQPTSLVIIRLAETLFVVGYAAGYRRAQENALKVMHEGRMLGDQSIGS